MIDNPKNMMDQEPEEPLPFVTDMDISPMRVSPSPSPKIYKELMLQPYTL